MSPREKRLRERIDVVTAQRDAARRQLRRRRERPVHAGVAGRHCVYCGSRINNNRRVATCASHQDLTSLDPFYSEVVS